MNSLHDVLSLIGFNSREEQIAFVKLTATYGFFSKPVAPYTSYSPAHLQRQEERAEIAARIWEKTAFSHLNLGKQFINDEQAEMLLTTPFPSLEMASTWLIALLEMNFRRSSYDDEGVGSDKEKTAVNTQLWNTQDCVNIDEIPQLNKRVAILYDYFKAMKLFDASPWPSEKNVKHVVVFSSMAKFVQDLVNFLPQFKLEDDVTIYFLSGPRGLFNQEAPLAAILADWFDVPDKLSVIQAVLDEHRAFSDPLNWTRNLSGLKQKILSAIGKASWCNAKGNWYNLHADLCESHTNASGMESLKGWPLAIDMFDYLIKKRGIQVRLVWAPGRGQEGRLATTADLLQVWYKQYGKKLYAQHQRVVFVASPDANRSFHTLRNITSNKSLENGYATYQVLANLANFNDNKGEYKTNPQANIFVAGPKAKTFSIKMCLDIVARSSISALSKQVDFRIKRYQLLYGQMDQQVSLIKQVNFYHEREKFILLVHALVNLALDFYGKKNFIKTSGLMNVAQDVLTSQHKEVPAIFDALDASLLQNMQAFISSSFQRLHCARQPVDASELKKQKENNKKNLENIRKLIASKFNQVTPFNREEIAELYHFSFAEMQRYIMTVIDQAHALYKSQRQNLCFAFLGSNSGGRSTCYSDLEFFVLIENNDAFEDVKEQMKYSLLKVLDLRETGLPALGITVSDHLGREFNLTHPSLTKYTRRGLCFDYNEPKESCKTPLGAKVNGTVVFRLMGTPQQLADLAKSDKYLMPQVLRLSKMISWPNNNTTLYKEFQTLLREDSSFDLVAYRRKVLLADIHRYLPLLNEIETLTAITHKNYFYRPVAILLDGLYLMLSPVENEDPYVIIHALHTQGIFNDQQKEVLEQLTTAILYLRIKQYLKNQQKTINISLLDEEGKYLKSLLLSLRDIFVSLQKQLLEEEKIPQDKIVKISNFNNRFFGEKIISNKSQLNNDILKPY